MPTTEEDEEVKDRRQADGSQCPGLEVWKAQVGEIVRCRKIERCVGDKGAFDSRC